MEPRGTAPSCHGGGRDQRFDADRAALPRGRRTCVRPWAAPAVELQLHRLAAEAGVRRRFARHPLSHAHAVEMAREGVPLNVIQRYCSSKDKPSCPILPPPSRGARSPDRLRRRLRDRGPRSAGLLLELLGKRRHVPLQADRRRPGRAIAMGRGRPPTSLANSLQPSQRFR